MAGRQAPVHAPDDLLLAGVGAGGEPARPRTDGRPEALDFGIVGGQRRRRELEVARARHAGCAEAPQTLGVFLGLAKAKGEPAKEMADQPRCPPPAGEGGRRDAPVDEHHGHAPRRRLADQVGPELGLRPQHEVRLPVIEEAPHVSDAVDRQVLMEGPGRQTLGHEPSRGDGARGDQSMQARPVFQEPSDKGQQRQGFANACRVRPHQPALGAGKSGAPEAFAEALLVFLAGAPAARQVKVDERCSHGGRRPVEGKHHDGAPSAGAAGSTGA